MLQVIQKMDFMTNEESFTERRQLFKNIWETAMNIDEKEDIMNKPKVIKTLRLDEVDKCVVGRKKKQRIKNLRHVCNKILDFCDRQDADDVFYEQMAADGTEPGQVPQKFEVKSPKKMKPHKGKKKVKKAKSMFAPIKDVTEMKGTVSERKDELTANAGTKMSRNTSPIHITRTTFVKNYTAKAMKSKTSPRKMGAAGSTSVGDTKGIHGSTARRTVKKRHSKRKKPSDANVLPTGHKMRTKYQTSRNVGRAAMSPTKNLQILPKVIIN